MLLSPADASGYSVRTLAPLRWRAAGGPCETVDRQSVGTVRPCARCSRARSASTTARRRWRAIPSVVPDLAHARGGQVNGLCGAAVPGVLWLTTGPQYGQVWFTVELHDTEPPVGDGWEEVVEVSFTSATAEVHLLGWGGGSSDRLDVGPGDWRVRYCLTEMDDAPSRMPAPRGEPPLDRYLLQFWPAEPAPDRVVRQTSAAAADWHRVAAETAPPPPPPTPEEIRAAEEEEQRRRREARRRWEVEQHWSGRAPSERLRTVGGNVCFWRSATGTSWTTSIRRVPRSSGRSRCGPLARRARRPASPRSTGLRPAWMRWIGARACRRRSTTRLRRSSGSAVAGAGRRGSSSPYSGWSRGRNRRGSIPATPPCLRSGQPPTRTRCGRRSTRSPARRPRTGPTPRPCTRAFARASRGAPSPVDGSRCCRRRRSQGHAARPGCGRAGAGIVGRGPPTWRPRRQMPCSLGVTEGTRTPDLQGHNLGAVAGGKRSRPSCTGSDLRQVRVAADVDPRAPKATGKGVGAGMLPSDRTGRLANLRLCRHGCVTLVEADTGTSTGSGRRSSSPATASRGTSCGSPPTTVTATAGAASAAPGAPAAGDGRRARRRRCPMTCARPGSAGCWPRRSPSSPPR